MESHSQVQLVGRIADCFIKVFDCSSECINLFSIRHSTYQTFRKAGHKS